MEEIILSLFRMFETAFVASLPTILHYLWYKIALKLSGLGDFRGPIWPRTDSISAIVNGFYSWTFIFSLIFGWMFLVQSSISSLEGFVDVNKLL